MARKYADRGTLDLVAMLAEHCTHPDAQRMAHELELRVVLLAGLAAGCTDLEVARPRVSNLIHGVGHDQRPPSRGRSTGPA